MRWSLESMKLLRCSLLVARFPLPPRQNRRRLHAHTHTQGHIQSCVHLGVQQLRGGISKLEGKAAASKTRGKLSATPLPFPTAGARLLSGAVSSRAGRLLPERPPLRGAARTSPCSAERLVLPEFGAPVRCPPPSTSSSVQPLPPPPSGEAVAGAQHCQCPNTAATPKLCGRERRQTGGRRGAAHGGRRGPSGSATSDYSSLCLYWNQMPEVNSVLFLLRLR